MKEDGKVFTAAGLKENEAREDVIDVNDCGAYCCFSSISGALAMLFRDCTTDCGGGGYC